MTLTLTTRNRRESRLASGRCIDCRQLFAFYGEPRMLDDLTKGDAIEVPYWAIISGDCPHNLAGAA